MPGKQALRLAGATRPRACPLGGSRRTVADGRAA